VAEVEQRKYVNAPVKRKALGSPAIGMRLLGNQGANTRWAREDKYSNTGKTCRRKPEDQATMQKAIGNYCRWSDLFSL